jgi:nucleoside-diphosphate-sugar epimerase
MVLSAHARGDVGCVIGRGAELYGPRVESLLGANLFGAVPAGRRAHWIGDPDLPVTPLFIGDFARGLAVLGERPEALGRAWHVPHPPPLTGREFVGLIAAAAGTRPRTTGHGTATVRALGLVSSLAREGAELVYQFEQPFVVDGSRFVDAFGGRATPHEEGVRQTLAWYRTARGRRVRALGR